jgi:hypothetical protein
MSGFVEGVCMYVCCLSSLSSLLLFCEPYVHILTLTHTHIHPTSPQYSTRLEASSEKGPQYTHTHTPPRRE